MTKQELKDAILGKNPDVEFDPRINKAGLEDLYMKLFKHAPEEPAAEPEPEPVAEPEPGAEPEPEPEPAAEPEPEPAAEPEPGAEPEPAAEPVVSENEFNELLGKIKGAKIPEEKAQKEQPFISTTRTKRKKGASSPDALYINGYILLLITDVIFPFAFSFANNLLDKHVKVNAPELQLSEKDFEKLEPVADQAANYMSMNLNPVAGYLLIATFMYGNNLMVLRAEKTVK